MDPDKAIVIAEDPDPFWGKFTPYADFRFRYEADWDSSNAAGVPRDDRHRLRVRGRAGLKFEATDHLMFDVRARTGNSEAQQSPHLTIHDFNGGDRDDFDGILDKYYAQYSTGDLKLWGGRNGFPFWKQNEMFWDDDVTITGLALSATPEALGSKLTGTTGVFYLPDGGWGLNGQMYAGQVAYTTEIGDAELTWAEGFYFLKGQPGAEHLLNGNGARDYAILGNQFQLKKTLFGTPVILGADTYFNLKDYSASDSNPFTAANADETFGYVLSATVGQLKDPGDFQFGYYYSYIEALAVNASYAQDDWIRWGTGGQTTSSDLSGHEIRSVFRATPKLDIMARLYVVDAITSEQDGMRFRIDFNYKF